MAGEEGQRLLEGLLAQSRIQRRWAFRDMDVQHGIPGCEHLLPIGERQPHFLLEGCAGWPDGTTGNFLRLAPETGGPGADRVVDTPGAIDLAIGAVAYAVFGKSDDGPGRAVAEGARRQVERAGMELQADEV